MDLEDLKKVLKGSLFVATGISKGNDSANNAVKVAINSFAQMGFNISIATKVLVSFKIHPDYSLLNMTESMNIIEELIRKDADMIFGTMTEETLPQDYIDVTIIASSYKVKHAVINNV